MASGSRVRRVVEKNDSPIDFVQMDGLVSIKNIIIFLFVRQHSTYQLDGDLQFLKVRTAPASIG